ncbi:hypothetical protein PESP_a1399 [Pseudoalteromonas espejiana DSM 9414]|nr:hypothetical protein PESP_a1399 [Pseudoalteromonas espejiana DSM 9414]
MFKNSQAMALSKIKSHYVVSKLFLSTALVNYIPKAKKSSIQREFN